MIRWLALLITKGVIGQGIQTVIIGITYGAFLVKTLDIHGRNVGNSMVSQPHLTKSGVTIDDNGEIMSKHTCVLFNQLKKNPWNKAESIKRRLKNWELCWELLRNL